MRDPGYWLLPGVIAALALADGVLHLLLDFVLFQGRLWGPPPGGAAPTALPFVPLRDNQLFLLNFIGFIVLAAALWLVLLRCGRWVWAVDVALLVYTAVTIFGWVREGRPNPQGLGRLAEGFEIALLVVLLAYLWYLFQTRPLRGSSSSPRPES
ncbi:MAG TPA: hypothetical protein VFW96_07180 [Thermomicrobiales bacterium]|nr:hypothetical protein [Thermomicrobiales bacterium]